MRSSEERAKVIALKDTHNKSQISRMLGISRTTIRDIIFRYENPTLTTKGSPFTKENSEKYRLPMMREADPESEVASYYAYILGLYLGDGHITKGPRCYRMRITLDCKYPGIIEETIISINKVFPYNKTSLVFPKDSNCVVVVFHSSRLAEDFPQHGEGFKHDRDIILADWQQELVQLNPKEFLRGLIYSDGSRDVNKVSGKSYPRYQFTNKSEDIFNLCKKALDTLDVPYKTTMKYAAKQHVLSVAKRKHVESIDAFLGPKDQVRGILPPKKTRAYFQVNKFSKSLYSLASSGSQLGNAARVFDSHSKTKKD